MAQAKNSPSGNKPSRTTKHVSALATKAQAAVKSKRARVLKQARADIAMVRRRRAEITEAFYDMGEALRRLKQPEVIAVLGHASFEQLCTAELELSVTTANRLIDIVTNLSREDALRLGQKRANALIGLADATPEHDTATSLSRKRKLKLPSGAVVDATAASANELEAAAAEVRRARRAGTPSRGGRTVSEAETKAAASLQAALRKLGASGAKVSAVATRPGAAAEIRIAGLTAAQLPLLRKAAPAR